MAQSTESQGEPRFLLKWWQCLLLGIIALAGGVVAIRELEPTVDSLHLAACAGLITLSACLMLAPIARHGCLKNANAGLTQVPFCAQLLERLLGVLTLCALVPGTYLVSAMLYTFGLTTRPLWMFFLVLCALIIASKVAHWMRRGLAAVLFPHNGPLVRRVVAHVRLRTSS
jgi:uncharacterized membrane protein HdeD (DUF308 family)